MNLPNAIFGAWDSIGNAWHEIVNLTRRIVIQGADDADWQVQGFGAHVMVMGLQSRAQVDGVEFRRCGQRRAPKKMPSIDFTEKFLSECWAVSSEIFGSSF